MLEAFSSVHTISSGSPAILGDKYINGVQASFILVLSIVTSAVYIRIPTLRDVASVCLTRPMTHLKSQQLGLQLTCASWHPDPPHLQSSFLSLSESGSGTTLLVDVICSNTKLVVISYKWRPPNRVGALSFSDRECSDVMHERSIMRLISCSYVSCERQFIVKPSLCTCMHSLMSFSTPLTLHLHALLHVPLNPLTMYLHALLDVLLEVIEGFLVRGAEDGAEDEVSADVRRHDPLRTLEDLHRGAMRELYSCES